MRIINFVFLLVLGILLPRFEVMASLNSDSQQDLKIVLLGSALEGVNKFPPNPHIKNRSRDQYQIVKAYLELGEFEKAIAAAEQIDNWYRWLAYADISYEYACAGDAEKASLCLNPAKDLISQILDYRRGKIVALAGSGELFDTVQGWRFEQIYVRCVQVEAVLQNQTLPTNIDLEDESQQALLDIEKSSDYDRYDLLVSLSANDNFEVKAHALLELVSYTESHYADVSPNEAWIRAYFFKPLDRFIPYYEQARVLLALSDMFASRNSGLALFVLNRLVETHEKLPSVEQRIDIGAQIAKLMVALNRVETATEMLETAVTDYDGRLKEIMGTRRADILCFIAEVYAALGQNDDALLFYRKALKAGLVNSNSRPRADDITAIVVSMAGCQVEPDEAFVEMIEDAVHGLGHPW